MRYVTVSMLGLALLGVAGCSERANRQSAPASAEKTAEVAKEKDPVCGMMVDPKTSEKAAYKGKTYYFCAREEREEFEKNPAKYVTD